MKKLIFYKCSTCKNRKVLFNKTVLNSWDSLNIQWSWCSQWQPSSVILWYFVSTGWSPQWSPRYCGPVRRQYIGCDFIMKILNQLFLGHIGVNHPVWSRTWPLYFSCRWWHWNWDIMESSGATWYHTLLLIASRTITVSTSMGVNTTCHSSCSSGYFKKRLAINEILS